MAILPDVSAEDNLSSVTTRTNEAIFLIFSIFSEDYKPLAEESSSS